MPNLDLLDLSTIKYTDKINLFLRLADDLLSLESFKSLYPMLRQELCVVVDVDLGGEEGLSGIG